MGPRSDNRGYARRFPRSEDLAFGLQWGDICRCLRRLWGRQASRKDTGAADNYISCARDAGRARGGGNGRPAAMTMPGRFFGSQKLCFLRDRQQRTCSHPPPPFVRRLTKRNSALCVIPGRRQVGFCRPAGEPGIHNPRRGAECHVPLQLKACGYGFGAPLAEPVLGRRVAPIRVLAAPE